MGIVLLTSSASALLAPILMILSAAPRHRRPVPVGMGLPARSACGRGVALTLRAVERPLRAPAADGRGLADGRRDLLLIPSLRSLWPLALLWVLEAAAFAAAVPAEEALVVDIAGADRRGTAFGYYTAAACLGRGGGPAAGRLDL